jgi:hypothetical protein
MTLLPTGSSLPTPEQEPAKRHRQAPVQLCDIGFTACYVGKFPSPWKRSTSTSWECVDLHNNIETCGGCKDPVDGASSGKDCTDMEGIDEVTVSRSFHSVCSSESLADANFPYSATADIVKLLPA